MDRSTAQAIHDLATTGRLSPASHEVVADVLGLELPEDEDTKDTKPAGKAAAR